MFLYGFLLFVVPTFAEKFAINAFLSAEDNTLAWCGHKEDVKLQTFDPKKPSQWWYFESKDKTNYKFRNLESYNYFEIDGGAEKGKKLTTGPDSDGKYKQWHFDIKWENAVITDGKPFVVDTVGGKLAVNVSLITNKWLNVPSQRWIITNMADYITRTGATSAKIKPNNNRDAEIAKHRKDLEELSVQHESSFRQRK